jgi:protein SCO1/2
MKKRLLKTFTIVFISLAAAAAIAAYQIQDEENGRLTSQSEKTQPNIVSKNFGGDFTLVNQDGETVTQDDYVDRYRLIYFGFTYCPAICPTELQKMSQALTLLGDKGEEITPIFITVDPERDTVETMKQYVELFHPRLIGLTGTPEQIKTVKKAYKIYATKVKEEGMNDYTVDHSSFIYFLDPDNNLIRIFKTDDTADDMTNTIKQYM